MHLSKRRISRPRCRHTNQARQMFTVGDLAHLNLSSCLITSYSRTFLSSLQKHPGFQQKVLLAPEFPPCCFLHSRNRRSLSLRKKSHRWGAVFSELLVGLPSFPPLKGGGCARAIWTSWILSFPRLLAAKQTRNASTELFFHCLCSAGRRDPIYPRSSAAVFLLYRDTP